MDLNSLDRRKKLYKNVDITFSVHHIRSKTKY